MSTTAHPPPVALPLDEDADHARGERVIVRVDPESKRPTEWTAEFREMLAPYRRDLDAEDGSVLQG